MAVEKDDRLAAAPVPGVSSSFEIVMSELIWTGNCRPNGMALDDAFGGVDLEDVLFQVGHAPFEIIDVVLRRHPERDRVEHVVGRVR